MIEKKYVMVVNTKKCLGCKTCTIACNTENSVFTTKTWQMVLDTVKGSYPDYKRKFYARPCMHCEEPPCVDVCPTGASYEKEEWGIVLVNQHKCIGCRSCMTACPYEARVFNWEKPEKMLTENPVVPVRRIGVVEKCTFCIHKIEKAHKNGLLVGTTIKERDKLKVIVPACVRECVGGALYFGDLNDPSTEVYELVNNNIYKRFAEEAGTKPNVYYIE
ncbi:MAG: 4Fe-4S dicluster domain-containing protein [Candidatus Omnitrophica bacterium]|nr:4Fe-4S dicluster domain-containing protein [Candidatus Omnitrophota bacterium]